MPPTLCEPKNTPIPTEQNNDHATARGTILYPSAN